MRIDIITVLPEMIEKNGGKNVGSISSKTSFILAGEKMCIRDSL